MINWIIGAVIAVAVVVSGGFYYMSGGGYSMMDDKSSVAVGGDAMDTKTKPGQVNSYSLGSTNAGSNMTGTGGKAAPFTGSFFDLAARGGNYSCAVESAGANNGTTGTVYVSGTNLRGDFTTVATGKTIESHMLKKADDIFIWSSAMPQGIMMKATAMQKQDSTGATQGTGVSGTQSYGWNCTATGVDASKFVKPAGVEFMDIGAMMGGAVPSTGMMPKIPAY